MPHMPSENVKEELGRSQMFGAQLEDIVVKNTYKTGERNTLLLAYWEVTSECHKGILSMINAQFFAPAFSAVRLVVENLLRAHVAIMGTDDEVKRLIYRKIKNRFL